MYIIYNYYYIYIIELEHKKKNQGKNEVTLDKNVRGSTVSKSFTIF